MIKITNPLINFRIKMIRVQYQIMDVMNEDFQEKDGQGSLHLFVKETLQMFKSFQITRLQYTLQQKLK
ncbi:unnamed protein product [Paramecium sonneborni]|uniref:Uncharacterized protein n=1 Tax=Paramecium sonneborni TaxID=65129 RepID=A0A8S1MLA5_9CILI|nr:unnamed protein product [Paramecium sonneborni]